MESKSQVSKSSITVEIDCQNRWVIYHRLQELDIACDCSAYKPLTIQIDTLEKAIQLWSISRRVSQPHQQLIGELEKCWQLYSYRSKG